MKPSAEQVRRHHDGSIDIAHYAARAQDERKAAMREALAVALHFLRACLTGIGLRAARL